jgi:hypothetical protein
VTLEVEIKVQGILSLEELGRMNLVVDLHPQDGSIFELEVSNVQSNGLVFLDISNLSSMPLHQHFEVLVFLHSASINCHVQFCHFLVDSVLDFFIKVLGIEGR